MHIIFKIIMFFILIGNLSLYGQGLIFDDDTYNHQPRQPQYGEGSKSESEALSGIYKIDLKPFCPVPQDQGLIASCAGWASGYGAMTILNAIQNNWSGQQETITQNALSALFIFNQIRKGSCNFGSYISDAAELLRDKGDVLSKEFDRLKNNCDKKPSKDDYSQALNYRIKDYMTLFASDDPPSVKIQETKLSLAQKKPVVIGMNLLNNFQKIKKGDEFWFPEIGDTSIFGGHAMVIIGFDDGKEAFEIMNSWGTNWGNDGFIWIKYKDFGKYCRYGFQFIPYQDNDVIKHYNASVTIRKPRYNENDDLYFSEEKVAYRNGYYEINVDTIQPLVQHITDGTYLYVFSYDAQKNIKIHWPRDEHFDSKFDGKHESAIISIANINLAIPNQYGALISNTSGDDYICFIISKSPISQLNKYLSTLKGLPVGDFNKNLYKAFGKMLEPQQNISYSKNKIEFESDLTKGTAVPIILKIK